MSISGITGGSVAALSGMLTAPGAAAAGNAAAGSAGVAGGSGDGALIANLAADSSGVSAAIQSLSSALGSIINTTA
jgi:hypothetical protein